MLFSVIDLMDFSITLSKSSFGGFKILVFTVFIIIVIFMVLVVYELSKSNDILKLVSRLLFFVKEIDYES